MRLFGIFSNACTKVSMSSFTGFPPGCLDKAAEVALQVDKPIQFDYYMSSLNGACSFVRQEKDKVLFKTEDEYTSPIVRLLKIPGIDGCDTQHLLCETYNSLYIVHAAILSQTKKK